jgi:hypothetical protein
MPQEKNRGEIINGLNRIKIPSLLKSKKGKNTKARQRCPVKWKIFPQNLEKYATYFL